MHSLHPPGGGTPPIPGARRHGPCGLRPLAALAFALSLGIAQPVLAQTPPPALTLAAALEAAQARSAALQAQDAAARAARDMAVAAARLPDPTLRLSVDNLPIEGPTRYSLTEDSMTQRSLEFAQTYLGHEKRQARAVRFEREADAAASLRSLQKAQLLAQTAGAWFERYYQEQALALLQRQREEARRVGEAVESAYRGGRSSLAEVLAARAAAARIDERLHEAGAELAAAQAQLRRWVGEGAEQALGAAPPIDRTRLTEHPLDHALERHPDLALMDARERVALAEADVARQEKNADWSWSVMYSQRGRQFGDMVSLGVSIPWQWDRARKQDRELVASLERVEQVRLEREEARREHLLELQRLLAQWRSQLLRLKDYDQTLVPLATERVQATLAAFAGGKASLAEVLDAQRMVSDTRLERLRIEKQSAAGWVALEYLIPADTTDPNDPAAPAGAPRPSNPSPQEQAP
ncbi:MAG: TolC family protein [Rhodoferax sp.]